MGAKTENITIANNGQNSTTLAADKRSLIAIQFPTMTSTAVTIQGSNNGTTWVTLGDKDGAYSIASPSGRGVNLAPSLVMGWPFLRLVGGSGEGGERTIAVTTSDFLV